MAYFRMSVPGIMKPRKITNTSKLNANTTSTVTALAESSLLVVKVCVSNNKYASSWHPREATISFSSDNYEILSQEIITDDPSYSGGSNYPVFKHQIYVIKKKVGETLTINAIGNSSTYTNWIDISMVEF